MRHVAITGASSGIGAALARELASGGYRLTLIARRRERLEELAAELDTETRVEARDLAAGPGEVTGWIEGAESALGPVECLVNNAGIQIIAPLAETDPDGGDRTLEVDLRAPLRLSRELLPGMLERDFGILVHMASIAAFAPTPYMAYYDGAKAGIAAFSESLAGELAGTGVRSVTVYPGPIRTSMGEAGLDAFGHVASARMAPMGTPEGLAQRVRRAMERGRSRVVYPGVYRFFQLFPGTARWLQARFGPRPVGDSAGGSEGRGAA